MIWEGEGSTMCHTYFFAIWNTIFKAFQREKFCLEVRIGSKRYFLSYSFCSYKQIVGLKICDQKDKNEKCHLGDGGRKSAKEVTGIICMTLNCIALLYQEGWNWYIPFWEYTFTILQSKSNYNCNYKCNSTIEVMM